MMNKNDVQDAYIEQLIKACDQVAVYLINGIKLIGVISQMDSTCIILAKRGEDSKQLVYKATIATIGRL